MNMNNNKFYFKAIIALITLCTTLSANAFQLSAIDIAQYKQGPSPVWVIPPAIKSSAKEEHPNATSYLLIDRQVNALQPQQQRYFRYRFRINNSSALSDNSDIKINFTPDYQQLEIHSVNIIRAGKIVKELDIEQVKIINDEASQQNNIYNGSVVALILLKDTRVGDIIDYSYTVIGNNPVFKNNFYFNNSLGWSITVKHLNLRVLLPNELKVDFRVVGSNIKPVEVVNNGQRIITLEQFNSTEIPMEDNAPSWFDPSPFIEISSYADWQQVAQWATDIFQVKQPLSVELSEYIESLKTLDKQQAINNAIVFVQDNVRYLGLELGVNSHMPHSPNEVFQNRYGDCKDKTLLLVTILKELNVTAYPALVSSQKNSAVANYLPTHSMFNHVIVKLVHNEQSYWVDPTITYQGSNLAHLYQHNYGKALIVDNQTVALSNANPTSSHFGKVEILEQHKAADYFSPVEKLITTSFYGSEAEYMRYRLASEGQTAIARHYLNYYAKKNPEITSLGDFSVSDDRKKNKVTIKERYLIPEYWQHVKNTAEFSLTANYAAGYLNFPTTVKRQQPFWLHWPTEINHQIELQLPEHINFGELESKTIDNKYISFKSTLSYDIRVLTLTTQYKNKQNFIAAKDTKLFIDTLNDLDNYLAYYKSITNVGSDKGIDAMQRLIENLNLHISAGE